MYTRRLFLLTSLTVLLAPFAQATAAAPARHNAQSIDIAIAAARLHPQTTVIETSNLPVAQPSAPTPATTASTPITTFARYYPSITPSAYYTMPGGAISYQATGFKPLETVVFYAGVQKTASTTADASGTINFANVKTTPAQAHTTVTYTMIGASSLAIAKVGITVGAFVTQAWPSAYYLIPGQTLSFNGSGYVPGETVSIINNGIMLETFQADAAGSFSNVGAITMSDSQQNSSVRYILSGDQSKQTARFSVTIGQDWSQPTHAEDKQ